MNPMLDQFLVCLGIGLACGFFVWSALRKGSGKACGSCCGKKNPLSASQKRA